MPQPDVRDRLMYLLKTPGGLCFRRVAGTSEAIMDDVEFQLLCLLGMGDQTGEEMWAALAEIEAGGRLFVAHDHVKDETWLGLKPCVDDEELG